MSATSTFRGRTSNPVRPPPVVKPAPLFFGRLSFGSRNISSNISDSFNRCRSNTSSSEGCNIQPPSPGRAVTGAPDSSHRFLSAVAGLGRRHNADRSTMEVIERDGKNLNVLHWLELFCPPDVLPKVLAFAGPQKAAALAKTNRHWNTVIKKEGTWRVLCEELYKWKQGDPEPPSWAELYRLSPCVPIDYRTVYKALEVATGDGYTSIRRTGSHRTYQRRGIRILLRPGIYYLKEAIHIEALTSSSIIFETITMPENLFRSALTEDSTARSVNLPTPKRPRSLRNFMRCSLVEPVEPTEFAENSEPEEEYVDMAPKPPNHATLILRTRRHNEPVFRVRQGRLHLKGLEIYHNSHGIDIWNGNAAIQIQPPLGDDGNPIPVYPRPTAHLELVHVISRSGRGVVNIDGGLVLVRNCAVTDCAATGIYVGGPGSQAFIEQSDVARNGVGNRSRRGIARGHSGIYLEQGVARIVNCNISSNTLTGVSAVSPNNAVLTLENCDLMNNGTYQLEMPVPGSFARQQSVLRSNQLSVEGTVRFRSQLLASENDAQQPLAG